MRPLAAARNVLQNRQLYARGCERCSAGRSAFHELENFLDALALGSADERHRRTKLARQLGRINVAAAAFQIVGHIEDHQRRQLEAEDRRREHQMAAEVGAIQDQQQRIGLGDAGHGAGQDVARHLFIFRPRVQAVDAGQIDQHYVAVLMWHFGFTDALFYRDAGKVRHLLAQPSEAIEERRFAGVRRADDGHHVRPRTLRQ